MSRLAAPPVEPVRDRRRAPAEVTLELHAGRVPGEVVERAKEYIRAGRRDPGGARAALRAAAARGAVRRLPRLRVDQPVAVHVLPALGEHRAGRRVARGDGARRGRRASTVRPIAGTRPRGDRRGRTRRSPPSCSPTRRSAPSTSCCVDLGRNDVGRVAAYGHGRGDRALRRRALLARHAHRVERARAAGARDATASTRSARRFPAGHALGRAEDPRDGDHRGARAGAPRASTAARSATSTSRATWTRRSPSARPAARAGALYVQAGAGIVADSDPGARASGVRQQGARHDPGGAACGGGALTA